MSTVLCPHLNQTLRVSSIESLFHCTHQHLENDLHEAWNLWYNALGPVGEESGHKLQFFEFFYGPEEWWYCYTERKHDKDLWEWNPTVPCGAATILESLVRVSGLNPSAMVGYIPQDWPRGPLPGRMDIRVNLGQAGDYRIHQAWIAALAHELVHVFGLWHEHQRPDRDHYVCFNCCAVKGYDAAKEKVDKADNYSMEEVCPDRAIAALYGWDGIKDFDTVDHLDPASDTVGQNWYWSQYFPYCDYDEVSMMHYDSHAAH